MKNLTASFLLTLATAGSFVSGVALAADSAAPPASVAQATRIDEALSSSRLTVLGIDIGFRKELAGRPHLDAVIACTDSKLRPWFQQQFAQATASALNAQELSRGAQLAAQVPTAALSNYIASHAVDLGAEALAAHARDEDYFLKTSADRLGRPATERYAIALFVAWHKDVGVRMDTAIHSASRMQAYQLRTTQALKECMGVRSAR